MRAIQAWRRMEGHSHVQQSYIVRVPEDELDYHLPRIAAQQQPGLPQPNIVEVDDPLPVTGLVDRIAAVLREHEVKRYGSLDWRYGCSGCDWVGDSTDHTAHVAERIAEALQLTEETQNVGVYGLVGVEQRRWVSGWTTEETS